MAVPTAATLSPSTASATLRATTLAPRSPTSTRTSSSISPTLTSSPTSSPATSRRTSRHATSTATLVPRVSLQHSCPFLRTIWLTSSTLSSVSNENVNDLVDASDLDVFANVLSRRDIGNQECFCRPRQQSNCGNNNGWTPPRVQTPNVPNRPQTTHRAYSATPTWRHERPTSTIRRPSGGSGSCKSGYTFVNSGTQVMNKNENKLIDLSNLDLDINILSDNDQSERKTVKGTYTCNGSRGCCVEKAPSCSNGYTYVNSGTQIYNDNENKLIDLSNLSLDLNILSLGGASDKKTEKANWKCNGSRGCCVKKPSSHGTCKSGFKWVNKGVSVTNINENKLLDLSNAHICIALLSADTCEDKKPKDSNWSCDKDEGCCVKSVNKGTQVTNKNDNTAVDASGLDLGLNVLSDKDGKGLLGNKGGLLGSGLLS